MTAAAAPREVLDDLEPDEPVFFAVPVKVAASPGAKEFIGGVAVLTSERLAIVPGAPGSPQLLDELGGDSVADALAELWTLVKPAVLTAFPIAKLLVRAPPPKTGHLAARSRPGIEIPLQVVRRAFEARVPGWIGIELCLPIPDPRPPFAIYLQVGRFRLEAKDWAGRIEAHRGQARPRPELERPYGLYYLLRPPPRPIVRVRGPTPHGGGGPMTLAPDGPAIGIRGEVLLPYESITRLRWAGASKLRRARLVVGAEEREWWLEPRDAFEVKYLYDAGKVIGELAGVPMDATVGGLRSGRIAGWVAAAGATAASIAHFFL